MHTSPPGYVDVIPICATGSYAHSEATMDLIQIIVILVSNRCNPMDFIGVIPDLHDCDVKLRPYI